MDQQSQTIDREEPRDIQGNPHKERFGLHS